MSTYLHCLPNEITNIIGNYIDNKFIRIHKYDIIKNYNRYYYYIIHREKFSNTLNILRGFDKNKYPPFVLCKVRRYPRDFRGFIGQNNCSPYNLFIQDVGGNIKWNMSSKIVQDFIRIRGNKLLQGVIWKK